MSLLSRMSVRQSCSSSANKASCCFSKAALKSQVICCSNAESCFLIQGFNESSRKRFTSFQLRLRAANSRLTAPRPSSRWSRRRAVVAASGRRTSAPSCPRMPLTRSSAAVSVRQAESEALSCCTASASWPSSCCPRRASLPTWPSSAERPPTTCNSRAWLCATARTSCRASSTSVAAPGLAAAPGAGATTKPAWLSSPSESWRKALLMRASTSSSIQARSTGPG
mmetsp:Transcript_38239/g.118777  ORF Transcript_38239/g.118777 Transcript_38239/m.118777 type:complete len:225 (+) Transcript_38239:174-848(+)